MAFAPDPSICATVLSASGSVAALLKWTATLTPRFPQCGADQAPEVLGPGGDNC